MKTPANFRVPGESGNELSNFVWKEDVVSIQEANEVTVACVKAGVEGGRLTPI